MLRSTASSKLGSDIIKLRFDLELKLFDASRRQVRHQTALFLLPLFATATRRAHFRSTCEYLGFAVIKFARLLNSWTNLRKTGQRCSIECFRRIYTLAARTFAVLSTVRASRETPLTTPGGRVRCILHPGLLTFLLFPRFHVDSFQCRTDCRQKHIEIEVSAC